MLIVSVRSIFGRSRAGASDGQAVFNPSSDLPQRIVSMGSISRIFVDRRYAGPERVGFAWPLAQRTRRRMIVPSGCGLVGKARALGAAGR
jgi:hypothetical protein